MISIVEHIEYLAALHDCVVIPEWGAFIAHYTPASFAADDAATVLPPRRELVFNPDITHNDGLLASSLVRREGVSFDEAVRVIAANVTVFRQIIADGSELPIGHLGYFSTGDEGTMQFHPFSFGKVGWEFYGLRQFTFSTLATNIVSMQPTAPSITPGTEVPAAIVPLSNEVSDDDEEDTTVAQKKPHWGARLARIAAAVVILIAMALVLTTPITFNAGDEQQQLASMSVPEIHKAPAPTPKPAPAPAIAEKKAEAPIVKKDTAIAKTAQPKAEMPQGRYILVVSTLSSQKQADTYLTMHKDLQGVARVSRKGKNYRVYIDRSDNYGQLLHKALNDMPEGYDQGWVTKI